MINIWIKAKAKDSSFYLIWMKVPVYLNDFNVSTTSPHLRRALGIPPEGKNIFAMLKIVWNVDNVDDVAMASITHSSLFLMRVDGVSSPH